MIDRLNELLVSHRKALYLFFRKMLDTERDFLLRSNIQEMFAAFCETESGRELVDTQWAQVLPACQEAAMRTPSIYLAWRRREGRWSYLHVHVEHMSCMEISISEFLRFKEYLVSPDGEPDPWRLELDLSPFERGLPKLKETRSIGKGVMFLNRYLANRVFEQMGKGEQRLFEFLRLHQVQGKPLMLYPLLQNVSQLNDALDSAERYLRDFDDTTQWSEVAPKLNQMGFALGWGRTVGKIRETMSMLVDILEAPEPSLLAEFLSRIPMIFNVVVLTPHGYFGQSGVLGRPDTGGQVVYILDQVRALEKEMLRTIYNQGLDIEPQILVVTRMIPEAEGTTCNQRIEPIIGTRHTRILRVPFRNDSGEIVPCWISRFHLWPYIDRFVVDVEKEMLAEMGGRPDVVIGNYSDGNMVASLLAQRLGVTQCNIAHALEKTKYLSSALYWQEHEEEHHFAAQFTADLISMNTADFIITSTYQEIAGTGQTVGQYESYQSFTMPGLYRIVQGIDVYDPKFNIVSPGPDPDIYFPYTETDRRLTDLQAAFSDMMFGPPQDITRGEIEHPDRPMLFAMSRLDSIKNVTGLMEWYGRLPELREVANLFVVGGKINMDDSDDEEERGQIARMHELFDEYDLERCVRWRAQPVDRNEAGELYRMVADLHGAFVQPALFEAFGLTVVEAMVSGLPTFATCYGGPLEIIEDGISGFQIDPNHGDVAARRMLDFFSRSREDPEYWQRISQGGIRRVKTRYSWERYAEQLLSLSRIYGFWKYISNIEREETRRYLEMFYALMFRPLAERIPHD